MFHKKVAKNVEKRFPATRLRIGERIAQQLKDQPDERMFLQELGAQREKPMHLYNYQVDENKCAVYSSNVHCTV